MTWGPTACTAPCSWKSKGRARWPVKPDFVGFQIPDEFVVGYGLDFHDRYRNLPYLAALEPAELAEEPGR